MTAQDLSSPLATYLRDRRLSLGLSVSAAADGARVNRVTWATWEADERRPLRHNYAGIERVLRWAPGSIKRVLEGGGDPEERDESAAVDINYALRNLPPDLRELVDVYFNPDLTREDRDDILAVVRTTVRSTYLSLLRRQDAAKEQARRASERAG